MNRFAFSYTMVKRAHLVLQHGVGSVLRTRQGLTAVVAGLTEWQYRLAHFAGGDADAAAYIRDHSFREPELAAATGLERFVPPPAYTDHGRNWEIPVIRFPLAGACSHWACQRLFHADHGTKFSRYWPCPHCGKKNKGRVMQVPLFLACPAGHLDEIDWAATVEHAPGCEGAELTVRVRNAGDGALAKCLACGKSGVPKPVPCTGARPWLPGAAADECDHDMEVVSRASVKVYYANTKSAIHIPVDAELNAALVEWLRTAHWIEGRALETEVDWIRAADALCAIGWDVDRESAIAHIRHVLEPDAHDDREWAILDARAREFDVLSGRRSYPALSRSELIALEHPPIERYKHPLIGSGGAIIGITAVHRLTESRVLNGFSRITPRVVSPREGRLQMWGVDMPAESWLPGYRTHGEGIFLVVNGALFPSVGAEDDPSGRELFIPSKAGVAAHTLAHLLINQLAEHSGYSAPSIRDRVYDLPGGDVGVMVYTAEGDSMGTLGGLVAFAQPGQFEELLDRALEGAGWCPQDPVCTESTLDQQRGIHAACHQCVLLPETSCEMFNGFLDRRSIAMLAAVGARR